MILRFIIAGIFSLSLMGCGFHLRNAESLPPSLHYLYLQSPNHYSPFHALLADNLRALHITLVPTRTQAPLTLDVIENVLSHSDPGLVSTNMAVPYTFTLTTVVAIRNSRGEIITGPATFTTSRVIVLNSSQVLNSSIGLSTEQDIIRNNISKLYFWLISDNTRKALTHYANHSTRTQTTH